MKHNQKIKFADKMVKPAGIRTLEEMKEVVYDREWLKSADKSLELYYMYRDLAVDSQNREKLEGAKVRYDITVIPPKRLGCEYVKTLGHYHPHLPQKKVTYPEIYEVLQGKAHYLLQKLKDERIEEVAVIEAKEGEVVVIPPHYGHITINSSQENLKMANLVARNFSSIYAPIKEKKGGAYFELEQGWIKNENYSELPEIRLMKPTHEFENNIYGSFMEEPSQFKFLTSPLEYEGLFE